MGGVGGEIAEGIVQPRCDPTSWGRRPVRPKDRPSPPPVPQGRGTPVEERPPPPSATAATPVDHPHASSTGPTIRGEGAVG